MDKIIPSTIRDEEQMNRHSQQLLQQQRQSSQAAGGPVTNIQQNGDPSGKTGAPGVCPMHSNLMTITQLLESMNAIHQALTEGCGDDIGECSADPTKGYDENEILKQLNDLFTPILVTQGLENGIADQIKTGYQEAGVLTEQNIIQFDDDTRMAQLIATCALLIQKAKNTEKYRMYEKAAQIRNQMKLDMQKEEYDNAKALAQKFLVQVATTNNSSVARQAASDLLPATQH